MSDETVPRSSDDALAVAGHELESPPTETAPPTRGRVLAWALWDWGSASFNAVVTTFVFSTYLASAAFLEPDIAALPDTDPTRVAALAQNSTIVSAGLLIAGVLVALVAPVLGQRSDGSGRRKLWLAVNTMLVIIAMAAMFFVAPVPSYIWLGSLLLGAGNLFFEFASVNYNAMLVQVSTPKTIGRVSGFGWGMGYVGGIVLLILLLALFIGNLPGIPDGGLLGLPTSTDEGVLSVRFAVLASAAWFLVFAIPVLIAVPEIPRRARENRVSFVESYRVLARTVAGLWRDQRNVLRFLIASAIFRDGLAGVFTFGAIIAAQVFGFGFTEVLVFGVAANLVAGVGTFVGGWFDDRIGPKALIMGSLIGLVLAGSAVLFIGSAQPAFWVVGLFLTLFVGPVQSSSRSFLARITPRSREGEIFGLYATTGRAVSFLTPALFSLFVGLTSDTRFGALAIVLVLLGGLLLMIPVRDQSRAID